MFYQQKCVAPGGKDRGVSAGKVSKHNLICSREPARGTRGE